MPNALSSCFVVALAGQKGGSGKTTTALCLADEWYVRGQRVLLIDTDPQGTSRTWRDVMEELDQRGPTVVAMSQGFHRDLEQLSAGYDVVVIDCPPGDNAIQRAALLVSDLAIIPCGPGATDIWSMAETLELVRRARLLEPDLHASVLITRRAAGTVIGQQVEEAFEALEVPRFETTLGFRVAFQEAPNAGVGVTRYKPSGAAAREVRALTDEIDLLRRTLTLKEAS